MNVQAIQKGYYDQYREVGDVFVIRQDADFAPNWMLNLDVDQIALAAPAEPTETVHFMQKPPLDQTPPETPAEPSATEAPEASA